MQILAHDLPPSHDLVVWSCSHVGTRASSESVIREIVDIVARGKNTFHIHLGDAIEGKLVDGKHFSHEVHDAKLTPMAQAGIFIEHVRRIKKKCLGQHMGNHEMAHLKFGNITDEICKALDVPYAGFTARHIVKNAKTGLPVYRMLTTHGQKRVNSTSPDPHNRRKIMEGQLKRSLAVLGHGDCVLNLCGHTHKLIVVRPAHEVYLTDVDGELRSKHTKAHQMDDWIDEDLRWYATCGTQHRTAIIGATTYSERAGYGPVELGYVHVEVRDGLIRDVREVYLSGHAEGNA